MNDGAEMQSYQTARSTDRRPFRVLVVDDNRDAADTLTVLMGLWGHEARARYDAETGLEEATSFRPDCLVLDIGLPGMDGYELARHLQRRPDLGRPKLIALSAYSSEEHGRLAREAGFDYCLVKPADPHGLERLLHMLEETLRLAERTESLARENVKLATETR